jgi:Flp pilus assembly protein TadD
MRNGAFPYAVSLLLGACLWLSACAANGPGALSGTGSQQLADTALSGGNPALAIPLYKKILLQDPRNRPALIGLADALYQSSELQQARTVWQQLALVSPGDVEARLGLARILLREGRAAEAAEAYRALVISAPDNVAARAGLGMAYDLQDRHDLAQQQYRQALRLHPDDLALRNNLGLSLILSHQLRSAIDELLKIADVPSAPPQARYNLALAYGLLGNAVAAERILQQDMPAAQVQDNLQYYQMMRARLGLAPDGGAAVN